jgi:hypothetical protein
MRDSIASRRRRARVAGVLYLLNAIFGAFALLFVYARVYIPGDAAKSAGNLVANAGLVRAGVVADLVQATIWVFLALTLYRLLKQVSQGAAGAMVVLVAIGAGILMLNEVFGFESVRVATGAVNLTSVGAAGANALALLLLDAQHYGLLIAQIFFGLWLMPLGYLAYRSGWFPRALGVALVVGGACYLVDMLAAFLTPDLGKAIHGYITLPSAVAELWMVGYLLVIGVRTPSALDRLSAAA